MHDVFLGFSLLCLFLPLELAILSVTAPGFSLDGGERNMLKVGCVAAPLGSAPARPCASSGLLGSAPKWGVSCCSPCAPARPLRLLGVR